MRTLVVGILLMSSLALAHERHFRVVPSVFDPDHTRAVISRWSPFSQNGDPAIIMTKLVPTGENAAAVANVVGVKGITLTELGFDVFDGGHCGAGAPRYNVTLKNGLIFFFGCSVYGTHVPAPDNPGTFTRIRYGNGDAIPQIPGNIWPGFGHAQVAAIEIVFDEGTDQGSGFTAVADIDINGQIIEGPSDHDDDRWDDRDDA